MANALNLSIRPNLSFSFPFIIWATTITVSRLWFDCQEITQNHVSNSIFHPITTSTYIYDRIMTYIRNHAIFEEIIPKLFVWENKHTTWLRIGFDHDIDIDIKIWIGLPVKKKKYILKIEIISLKSIIFRDIVCITYDL